MDGIDFDKTMFIIDNNTTAMMVSIIANGKAVQCVFERKTGIDDDKSFCLVKNFAKACINVSTSVEIEVPSPFFVGSEKGLLGKVKDLVAFKRKMKGKFDYQKGYTYIGPVTSSIMRMLRCHKDNIRLLYHGMGDYCAALECVGVRKDVKSEFKNLFYRCLAMPNWNYIYNGCYEGYSMCDLRIPEVEWIDCMAFNSQEIELALAPIKDLKGVKENVIFLPESDYHRPEGINSDTTTLNEVNLDILKHANCENSNVFIKFHPTLYQLNNCVINNLPKEIQKHLGMVAYDIVQFIPDEVGGALLPIEVIIRYVGFDEIVCTESSTVWNLEKKAIRKNLNNTGVYDYQTGCYNKIESVMKKNKIINDTYILNGFEDV